MQVKSTAKKNKHAKLVGIIRRIPVTFDYANKQIFTIRCGEHIEVQLKSGKVHCGHIMQIKVDDAHAQVY